MPTTDLASAETVPFFDASRVPMETITVIDAETKKLSPKAFEVIGEKVSYRLAQRPGSYVVLKYVRPLIKRLDTQTIQCAPAPAAVLEGSRADVASSPVCWSTSLPTCRCIVNTNGLPMPASRSADRG